MRLFRSVAVFLTSRAEVMRALSNGDLQRYVEPLPDRCDPWEVPSVQQRGVAERSLAELDHDGFAFAVDPLDKSFFERRERRDPRWGYRIEVILQEGEVRLRKRLMLYAPWRGFFVEWCWSLLALRFYLEAAALLRLRGIPGIPTIRAIEPRTRSIYMDYIAGANLRHVLAQSGEVVHSLDVREHNVLARMSVPERVDREFALVRRVFGHRYDRQIRELILAANQKGVAILDLNPQNFMIGAKTQSLYLVDFECTWLDSFPNWSERLKEQDDKLKAQIHLDLSPDRRHPL